MLYSGMLKYVETSPSQHHQLPKKTSGLKPSPRSRLYSKPPLFFPFPEALSSATFLYYTLSGCARPSPPRTDWVEGAPFRVEAAPRTLPEY